METSTANERAKTYGRRHDRTTTRRARKLFPKTRDRDARNRTTVGGLGFAPEKKKKKAEFEPAKRSSAPGETRRRKERVGPILQN